MQIIQLREIRVLRFDGPFNERRRINWRLSGSIKVSQFLVDTGDIQLRVSGVRINETMVRVVKPQSETHSLEWLRGGEQIRLIFEIGLVFLDGPFEFIYFPFHGIKGVFQLIAFSLYLIHFGLQELDRSVGQIQLEFEL